MFARIKQAFTICRYTAFVFLATATLLCNKAGIAGIASKYGLLNTFFISLLRLKVRQDSWLYRIQTEAVATNKKIAAQPGLISCAT